MSGKKSMKAAPGVSVAGAVRSTMTNPMVGKRPSGRKVGKVSKRGGGRGSR